MYRGYKKEILSEPLNEFTNNIISCGVCDGIMKEPCGVGNPLFITCNACCSRVQSIPLPHLSQPILNMGVLCPTTLRVERGKMQCRWKGKLAQVEEHVAACEMFKKECDLNCGSVMKSCLLPEHKESYCKMREVQCQYCQIYFIFKGTDTHCAICPRYPIECTNERCQQLLARCDLPNHIEVCDFTEIVCDYVAFGCEYKMFLRDRDEHNEEHNLNHLRLEMKQMKNTIENLTTEAVRFSELAGYTLSLIWNINIRNSAWEIHGPSFKVPPSSKIFYPKYTIMRRTLKISVFFKSSGNLSFKFWTFLVHPIGKKFCTLNKRTNLELLQTKQCGLFADISQHIIAKFELNDLIQHGVIVDNALNLQIYALNFN